MKDLQGLKDKAKRLEDEAARARDLEKKCKMLEDTLKARNPNSIPMMLHALNNTHDEQDEVKHMRNKLKQTEVLMEEKDKEYERKLRTLRQEAERVKEHYDAKRVKTNEQTKIKELENEIETLKAYYNKRIAEIEERHKKLPGGKVPASKPDKPPKQDTAADNAKELQEQIDKLTKDNKWLS